MEPDWETISGCAAWSEAASRIEAPPGNDRPIAWPDRDNSEANIIGMPQPGDWSIVRLWRWITSCLADGKTIPVADNSVAGLSQWRYHENVRVIPWIMFILLAHPLGAATPWPVTDFSGWNITLEDLAPTTSHIDQFNREPHRAWRLPQSCWHAAA